MSLELLIVIAFSGAFITYFLGKVSFKLRDSFAVLFSCSLVGIIGLLYGKTMEQTYCPGFLGSPLLLRLNTLSWFFAITITVIVALSVIFSLSYMKGKFEVVNWSTLLFMHDRLAIQ